MILVSCRKDFDNTRAFAPQNLIREYPALPNLDAFAELHADDLAERMQGHHVLFLIHGFRNPLASVASAYQRVARGLAGIDAVGDAGYGLIVGFVWPGFATPAGFFPAVPFANRSAGFFRAMLELASRNGRTVDVQTHSLGARVALQALAGQTDGFVDNLMITAPAVDDEVLEPRREFHAALTLSRRCLVYHSDKDKTLRFAFRIGDAPEFDRALGWKGPQHRDVIAAECPDVFVIDCRRAIASHGGYRSSDRYYEHWSRIVREEPLAQFDALKP